MKNHLFPIDYREDLKDELSQIDAYISDLKKLGYCSS